LLEEEFSKSKRYFYTTFNTFLNLNFFGAREQPQKKSSDGRI